jgi:fermentation-respiration switch protein FrsA (DUF1100 family)
LITYLTIAVSAYLCVLAVMYVFQRKLMYAPNNTLGMPMASNLPEMVAVNLTNDENARVVSWYKSASTNKPTLVYFHGNAGNIGDRNQKIRPFLDHGIGVLLVGYRGYGNNEGAPSENGLYQDAELALDFLTRTGITPDHWIIYGESLGAAVGIEMASRVSEHSSVASVILEAPFSSMTDAGRSHYPWAPVGILLKDKYDSINKIARINCPLLLFHGTKDEVVPAKLGQKLFDTASDPKTAHWVEGAGHGDVFDIAGKELSIEFIERIWSDRR